MSKQLQILFNQSEITAGTRGASLGPEAIMTAARKQEDQFFSVFPPRIIPNFNAALDNSVVHPCGKRIEFLGMVMDEVIEALDFSFSNNEFPLLVSGDHGSAAGTLAGIKKNFKDQKMGVVWIDAHGDLHTPFTTPTGNMHGMPLAIALQEDNTPCKVNYVADETVAIWDELKSKGTKEPKMEVENLLFFGVRDTEAPEDDLIKRRGIVNHSVGSWRAKSKDEKEAILNAFVNKIDVLYVSFDVDSMDPDLTSYGTGTPVKNGFKVEEAAELLDYFTKQEKLVALEFVEINPCLDNKCNKMAEVTFDLLKMATQNIKTTISK